MSDKELMYIDDTLSHLKQFNNYLCYLKECSNDDVCEVINNVEGKNKDIYDNFYSLIK